MSEKFTKAERDALSDAPECIRRFVSTAGSASATAYEKVARAARAQRQAIVETRLLEIVKAQRDPSSELKVVTTERLALEQENRRLRKELTNVRALPAAVVYAEA